MEKDLVSVVIPVYKVEPYLEKCVNSVINQTYKNLEIILVDDGSPDNCPKMCDDFAKKDKRIKVIHKRNGGLSDSRNAGIVESTGKYLVFVDSDDFLIEDMIKDMLNNLKNTDSDISMCSWQQIIENDEHIKSIESSELVEFDSDEVFDLLFNKKVPLVMTAWAKLYKREIFDEIKYPKGKIHEDEFVIHEILSKCKRVCYVDKPYYCNLLRDSSITGQGYSLKRLDGVEAKKQRVEFTKKNKPEFYDKAIKQYLNTIILNYCYLIKYKLPKEERKKLVKEFNNTYAKLKNRDFIFKLFKFSKILTYFCLKIRKKLY